VKVCRNADDERSPPAMRSASQLALLGFKCAPLRMSCVAREEFAQGKNPSHPSANLVPLCGALKTILPKPDLLAAPKEPLLDQYGERRAARRTSGRAPWPSCEINGDLGISCGSTTDRSAVLGHLDEEERGRKHAGYRYARAAKLLSHPLGRNSRTCRSRYRMARRHRYHLFYWLNRCTRRIRAHRTQSWTS